MTQDASPVHVQHRKRRNRLRSCPVVWLRTLVSKDKVRMVDGDFDLDLAYVTARIVAMGFPAISAESLYRNPRDQVVRFLSERHGPEHVAVYNLCDEPRYRYSGIFRHERAYAFSDHCPPPFELMSAFVEDVAAFLAEDPQNAAFVHCKAGKGRTGTMICAYLLYSGAAASAEAAMDVYAAARSWSKKSGVNVPAQRRWVEWFDRRLHGVPILTPTQLLALYLWKEDHERDSCSVRARKLPSRASVEVQSPSRSSPLEVAEPDWKQHGTDGIGARIDLPVPGASGVSITVRHGAGKLLAQFWVAAWQVEEGEWEGSEALVAKLCPDRGWKSIRARAIFA